jgi:hypothetical protein
MTETFDLVGKKKKVLDDGLYHSVPRSESDPSKISPMIVEEVLYADYFSGILANDKVKVVTGNNWDLRADSTADGLSFGNNWGSPKVFDGFPISLDLCDSNPEEVDNNGLREKIVLSCDVNLSDASAWPEDDLMFKSWLYYIKTGLISQNTTHTPIVNTSFVFRDHYHETFMPFSPEEMKSKQPAGKAFFADYKTYYNERLQSNTLEADRAVGDQGNPRLGYENLLGQAKEINKSIPSIYGFLRLLSAEASVVTQYFNLSNLDSSDFLNPESTPLEMLLTLDGFLAKYRPDIYDNKAASAILGKIIGSNFKNIDADALFEQYIDAWTSQALQVIESAQNNVLIELEKKFSNLVFSPNIIPIMDIIEKYKSHFPYYCQLDFTAKLSTSLGDFMKKTALTRPMSALAAAVVTPVVIGQEIPALEPQKNWRRREYREYSEENIYDSLTPDPVTGMPPIKLAEKSLSAVDQKSLIINFDDLVDAWVKQEQGTGNSAEVGNDVHPDLTKTNDLGETIFDYTAFLRDDFSEPVNLDDEDNIIWKKIFGTAFYKKIINIYKNKRRTYSDLLAGKPAYTEDLFYRIQKSVKHADEEIFTPIQSILIPNTSDLDIVKFVDTQLKYSDDAVYKYDVYAQRIVFGSKYHYKWVNDDHELAEKQTDFFNSGIMTPQTAGELAWTAPGDIPDYWVGISNTPLSVLKTVPNPKPTKSDPDNTIQVPVLIKNNFHATFMVTVEPSIVLLEDKIFSTPEIMIMDKPPVAPDINIIPYRAVNNRVKMLISANVDRYRETPVILLDSDVEEFDKVQAAQLSFDGKVEFGSDDPVTRFQIFRTNERPKSYSNFELYQDINNTVFEESILPNTKYYYTFRAVDSHGHLSNPTPVYEVELIDEKGAVKPIIRMISMEGKKNKTHVKDCQKYIYLKPTLQQLYFSDNPEVDGVFSDTTKKKKYKMRLTSKGSGKKIDINFSFRKKSQN